MTLLDRIKRTKRYFQNHLIARKWLVFLTMFSIWGALLAGAITSPQRQQYTSQELETKRTFSNGTGEIELVSQVYSKETESLLLQFETTDRTAAIKRGIDSEKLNWQLFAKNKKSDMIMEIVPVIDNKITVIIRNVPKSFEAISIAITNTSVAPGDIDFQVSKSDDRQKEQSEESDSKNVIQFFVAENSKYLVEGNVEKVSREEFALSELEEEVEFQESQITKLKNSIANQQLLIEDDEALLVTLEQESQYLTGSEIERNESDRQTVEASIRSKETTIETAENNIVLIEEKIDRLQSKIEDIENGDFEFSDSIEVVEMVK